MPFGIGSDVVQEADNLVRPGVSKLGGQDRYRAMSGRNDRVVIPHLFGQRADYDAVGQETQSGNVNDRQRIEDGATLPCGDKLQDRQESLAFHDAVECQTLGLNGQRDESLAELERLLASPIGLTTAELRFSPYWDYFRDDPRFVALYEGGAKGP